MDNIKSDKYFIIKAVSDNNLIKKYVGEKSYDQFVNDDLLVDAVMFRLIQMVENLKNLSDEFKNANPKIHWGEIIGFRNGIVHEYGKTDYSIVYEIIEDDLDELRKALTMGCEDGD